MKTTKKLLSLALALAMLLSLGSAALAAGGDWADYQQYIVSFAVAGAPTEADAADMTAKIEACGTMDEMLAVEDLGVFFAVLGAMEYDDWVAAGSPADGGMEAGANSSASGEASGESAADDASGEASGESASGESSSGEPAAPAYGDLAGVPGDNAVVSYHEDSVTYISDGKEATVAVADGQTAYLSVDGVNIPMAPGNYDGTVVVDVVDPIFESDEYQKGDKDVDLSTELASVIYITEDGLQEGQSVLGAAASGEITDDAVKNVVITSEDVPALSGIRAGGSAVVEVEGVSVELSGSGGNDFMGQGAAFCATDGSTLIVRNSTATVSGWVRGCTFAGGQATLEAYDCDFICDAGEYDESGYVSGAGMSQPPKGLGVWGNTRLNNLVHNATEYYENCTFTSRNWGCLGVDAVEEGYLTCVNCEINITESGYGAYSIGACVDTFSGCTFNIHNGVVAFVAVNGTVILNDGTVANSDRYGIVTHQAMNMVSTVKVLGEGTEINSAYTSIMVKGRSADIEVGDGAALNADSGVIIQAQDNDDLGAGSVNADAVVAVDIHDTALEGDIVMSMAPAAGSTSTMAVVLDGASVDGAITLADAELAIPDGNITLDNILDVGMVTNTYAMRDDCALTVELTNGAVWNVTETSYVTELTVDASSAVNGTVTETAGGFIVEPAAAAADAAGDVPATDGTENQSNTLSETAQPASAEEYDGYEAYLRDFMENYSGSGGDGSGFDEGARAMALGELDSVGFGADVSAFPFEMYVTQFGADSFAAWLAKQ